MKEDYLYWDVHRFCPFVFSVKVALKTKMNMEHQWNDTDGKTDILGEKPAPMPLCP
jgi:hypothetical protein